MRNLLFIVMLSLFLTGCSKVVLYEALGQREATEMTAILLENSISVERERDKSGTYSLLVPEDELSLSVKLLSQQGYPRADFATLDSVFQSDRMISTPAEERAKFIYAMGQEFSHTISGIQGVLSARVHLVTPQTDPLARVQIQPSASVAIRYNQLFNPTKNVPLIKSLITNGIEGLEYDRVTVALFNDFDGAKIDEQIEIQAQKQAELDKQIQLEQLALFEDAPLIEDNSNVKATEPLPTNAGIAGSAYASENNGQQEKPGILSTIDSLIPWIIFLGIGLALTTVIRKPLNSFIEKFKPVVAAESTIPDAKPIEGKSKTTDLDEIFDILKNPK